MKDIVLLNRNLRLADNPALYHGSLRRNYCALFVFDEAYWEGNGRSNRQLKFALECLRELDESLCQLNAKVQVFCGSLINLADVLNSSFPNAKIHLNQCTDIGYYRDAIARFKSAIGPSRFKEYSDFGVQRLNFDRDRWSRDWERQMREPILTNPMASEDVDLKSSCLIGVDDLLDLNKAKFSLYPNIQEGGSKNATLLLDTFLNSRCDGYKTKMSNPNDAEQACSRLSPHLAFGSISMRTVFQKLESSVLRSPFKSDLNSFKKRLYWHCHFVQKLETEPELEFRSMHPMCDDLRESHNDEIIEKWILGQTGFPFLDACILFLRDKGWINFRMRAMIMSFASYNLWQPWQKTSPLLAELFVDYEPGIHISQVQMQSGVTGINLPRIYSVTKQSVEQDPYLQWTTKRLPILAGLDQKNTHEAELEGLYLEKIVDLKSSAKRARDLIWGIRGSPEFKNLARKVYLKHGSRKRQTRFAGTNRSSK